MTRIGHAITPTDAARAQAARAWPPNQTSSTTAIAITAARPFQ